MEEEKKILTERFDGAVLVVGIAFLILFLYTIQSVLSPFLVFLALLLLLVPYRRQHFANVLLQLTVLLFLVWCAYFLWGVLLPFFIAFLLAYVLHPLVTKLERFSISRWASSLGLLFLFVGIIISGITFIVPVAFAQFEELVQGISFLISDVINVVHSEQFFSFLRRLNFPADEIQKKLSETMTPNIEEFFRRLFVSTFDFFTAIATIFSHVVNIVIIPFLAFYLLKDFPKIKQHVKNLLPPKNKERITMLVQKIDSILGEYFRGAIVVACLTGILVGTFLSLVGIRYALVIGIVAALLDFIPYFGTLISAVIAVVFALLSGDALLVKSLLAVAVVVVVHLAEISFYSPMFIGKKVGMHPVVLVLSLFVFGSFLGFFGLLIAVPATAIIILFAKEFPLQQPPEQHFVSEQVH
jgi:predicted PurR-regulated permease PerM